MTKPTHICQIKPVKPNLSRQIYQTKPSKPSLPNHTYETNCTKPNLQNQTYQTKPTKPNQNIQRYKSKASKLNSWGKLANPNVNQSQTSLSNALSLAQLSPSLFMATVWMAKSLDCLATYPRPCRANLQSTFQKRDLEKGWLPPLYPRSFLLRKYQQIKN